MKTFHISDVLSITTGKLVSSRHIDGIYDILNFLTGDNLYTHQLPRAMRECKPWLRSQFPSIMEDSPIITKLLPVLDAKITNADKQKDRVQAACEQWVKMVQTEANLPEIVVVYEMGAEMHTHIDPVEEAQAMVGDKRVIVLDAGRKPA
jgi:allophanate hydrolase subunit 1